MKLCGKCNTEKLITDFHLNKAKKDGMADHCKICCKETGAKNYQANKVKRRQQMQEFYSTKEGRSQYLLNKSRERAKVSGLEHTITLEDINIPDTCPYLNINLTYHLGEGQLQTNASIDRIDSSLGYITGNIQIISRKANTMKSNATEEELICFARSILRNKL